MKVMYIVFSVVFLSGVISCKQDASNVQQEPTSASPAENPEGSAAAPAADEGPREASDARGSASLGHDYTFLTDRLLHYTDAVVGGKPGTNPYVGQWIDFMPDGTFKAGLKKEQTHTGTWAYNHDAKVLAIKPDGTTFKASEWKIKYSDQMMVWVGKSPDGNQSAQIRLMKSDKLPD